MKAVSPEERPCYQIQMWDTNYYTWLNWGAVTTDYKAIKELLEDTRSVSKREYRLTRIEYIVLTD